MAITYPLSMPTNYGMSNITLGAENTGAISQSPFTFNQQIIRHTGERWLATVTLPPMHRVDAEPWIAFLLSLKGTYGTFLLGDPNAVQPQGSVVRRNIFNYSEDFSNAYWSKANVSVVSTAETNPVSGLGSGVFHLIEDTATSTKVLSRNIGCTAGLTYAMTAYLKAGSTSRNAVIAFSAGAFSLLQYLTVDLSTGAFSISSGSPTVTVEDVGGFYKVVVTAVATTTSTSTVRVQMTNISPSYTGDGTSFIRISDFQMDQATAATPYQKTIGSSGPDVLVNGGSQSGETLVIDNMNQSVTGILKAGDYLQLSSGSGSRLHKVLADATTDASGSASVDIWPSLRSSPANNDVVTAVGARGRFRLAQNIQSYEINNISSYGITFDCVEAL
jgi:hypothetical protein